MAFFQNPFSDEFRGNWVLGDRQHALAFPCPPNTGRGAEVVVAWNDGPYDLSGNDVDGNAKKFLKIRFSQDAELHKNWAELVLDIGTTAATLAATEAHEIVTDLRDTTLNPNFSSYFEVSRGSSTASTVAGKVNQPSQLTIKQKKDANRFKFYVVTGQAETEMQFNARAGMAELPTYFLRHAISERFNFPDANNCIVALGRPIQGVTVANPGVITSVNHGLTSGDLIRIAGSNTTATLDGDRVATVLTADTFTAAVNVTVAGDAGFFTTRTAVDVIAAATNPKGLSLGLDFDNTQLDWQLLKGRSGIYNIQNITVDGSNRIIKIIEHPAGAAPGDLGRKIQYAYTGGNTSPDNVWETPHTLIAADIISPP